MPALSFHNREAVAIENDALRLTVLREGGHIAEIFDKTAGVSPLWVPRWPSIEPSAYEPAVHPLYGSGMDARLLSGIMGHSLCLDLFGPPSQEEFAAGVPVHGEASVNRYHVRETSHSLHLEIDLPLAQLRFERSLDLKQRTIRVCESVHNLTPLDRPLAWTQHVTLGPPFLDPRTTEFDASVDHSFVSETAPGTAGYFVAGQSFRWPHPPAIGGKQADLRRMHAEAPASAYTAHLGDQASPWMSFTAFSPAYQLALRYLWRREEFPWLGIWEENCSRAWTPWQGRTVTRGMEFGVSPVPETRRSMLSRKPWRDAPMYAWLSAHGTLSASYWITLEHATALPKTPMRPDDL